MTIYKYPLAITDRQILDIPRPAEILSVQVQNGILTAWFIVTPDDEKKPRRFWIAGTGHPVGEMPGTAGYLTTVQMGQFVWHVFTDAPRAN